MRFFASWWERLPVREVAPAALVVVLFGLGQWGQVDGIIRAILGPIGHLWG
jgi:hypothetical protein